MSELLPCPFCGGSVSLEQGPSTHNEIFGLRKWFGVTCRNTVNLGGTCAIEQRMSASEEAATSRWNMRTVINAWINVDERMPPDGDEVLIFTRSGHIALDIWDELHEDPIGMGGPTISIGHYWGQWEYEDISHWMPIPKAPA